MQLFQFLGALSPAVTPANSKVHLAVFNGSEDPMDVWQRGAFDDWQKWQTRQNFGRPHVVALISVKGTPHWLFAGCFSQHGCVQARHGSDTLWRYKLRRLTQYDNVAGRLIVEFQRRPTERQSYRNSDTFDDRLLVHELHSRPLGVPEFPGFKQVNIDFPMLETIVMHGEPSWRTALSAVSGVYLVSDPVDGKLYVGSAGGETGIWGRWCQYTDGHGNNVRLRKLVGAVGKDRAKHFCFSVLETADTATSHDQLLARERHWKRVLLSRDFGYNAN